MTKLLIISNNPLRPSFRQRIEMFLDSLRERGIDCQVSKLPKCYIKRWRLFRRSADFDAVLFHKKCLNFIDAKFLRANAKKIIYDFDDAVMFKPTQPDNKRTSHMRLFKRTAKLADCVIAGNQYLASFAREYNSNVHTIVTGLVLDDYKVDVNRPDDSKIRLVWIGSKATLKYLRRLREPLEQIARQFDNVVLRIICDTFFELDNMPVEQHRWSLDTQAVDLATSDIGLAPLCDNRFTRGKCGYKILQYMAAGLPVIASPVGVNREYIEKSKAGLLAENDGQWIEKLSTLIQNTRVRSEMADAGGEFVKRFDKTVLADEFVSVINDCVNNS